MNQKVKIVLTIAMALILSSGLSNTIFLASTPRINKPSLAKLKNLPGTLVNNSANFLASLFNPRDKIIKEKIGQFSTLPVSSMQRIGTGVYAQEDKKDNVVYIRVTKDAQWDERQINFQGKIITVRFPKGTFK